jgi:FkbM family methyltransferase
MKKEISFLGLTFCLSISRSNYKVNVTLKKNLLWNKLKSDRRKSLGLLGAIDKNFKSVECIVSPKKNTKFFYKDSDLQLPLDNGAGLKSLIFGEYDYQAISYVSKFIINHLEDNPPLVIDLGANCGLWSRQLLIEVSKNIKNKSFDQLDLIAYEADVKIAKMAERNLNPFSSNISIFHKGVSIKGGKKTFYFDDKHPTSSSLMPLDDRYYDVRKKTISTISAKEFQKYCHERGGDRPYIYKSDIEGLDLSLFIELDQPFHENIYLAIIESRIGELSEIQLSKFKKIILTYKKVYVWNRIGNFIPVKKDNALSELKNFDGCDLILSKQNVKLF